MAQPVGSRHHRPFHITMQQSASPDYLHTMGRHGHGTSWYSLVLGPGITSTATSPCITPGTGCLTISPCITTACMVRIGRLVKALHACPPALQAALDPMYQWSLQFFIKARLQAQDIM